MGALTHSPSQMRRMAPHRVCPLHAVSSRCQQQHRFLAAANSESPSPLSPARRNRQHGDCVRTYRCAAGCPQRPGQLPAAARGGTAPGGPPGGSDLRYQQQRGPLPSHHRGTAHHGAPVRALGRRSGCGRRGGGARAAAPTERRQAPEAAARALSLTLLFPAVAPAYLLLLQDAGHGGRPLWPAAAATHRLLRRRGAPPARRAPPLICPRAELAGQQAGAAA